MEYLPIFDPERSHLVGGAELGDAPDQLGGRTIVLRHPGDGFTFKAKGRCLGLVLLENERGGVVEISVLRRRHRVDLSSAIPRTRVFEVPLPIPGAAVAVTVKVTMVGSPHPVVSGAEAWILGAYMAGCQAHEIPARIRARVEAEPFRGAQLNQLTDVFKWYDPDWVATMDALAACPDYHPPDFIHRKAWEWVQTVFGLDCLGMVRPNVRALGVGVGWEPLSFFFANHLAEVIATDLYPDAGEWTDKEGNPRILADPNDFAPYPYATDRLKFVRMNGTRLDFPDQSFDVVWSCSSIEHFGGHEGAEQSMREVARVLRPGGVASVITEYVLPDDVTGDWTTFDREYFNLRCLLEYLLEPVPTLRLVQMVDLCLPDYYRRRPVLVPDEAQTPHGGIDKPHIVVRVPNRADITSVALFLRKEGGRRPATAPRRFLASAPAPAVSE